MPFTIVRQDITRIPADAIVNAANRQLAQGGGVCGAIFSAAGARELEQACRQLAPIQTGQAVITPGFRLPAKHIIHAVGPIYAMHTPEESRRLLADAYRNSLLLAWNNGCRSIAFPLISSGIYGFPKEDALRIATQTIESFIADHEMDVILAVFDKSSFSVSKKLLDEVDSFIDEHYVDTHTSPRSRVLAQCEMQTESICAPCLAPSALSLEDQLEQMEQPFADLLFSMIDKRGLSDAQVYKKANIDRKLFSKIRTKKGYTPKKQTILALAIALELDKEETEELLERAGYALSNASKLDVIVQFFISQHRYNIFELNEVLFKYDQPLLGSL